MTSSLAHIDVHVAHCTTSHIYCVNIADLYMYYKISQQMTMKFSCITREVVDCWITLMTICHYLVKLKICTPHDPINLLRHMDTKIHV